MKRDFDSKSIETFCRLFESGLNIVSVLYSASSANYMLAALHCNKSAKSVEATSSFDRNEIEWFSRNSYNFALENCSDLHPLQLSRLARSSIKVCSKIANTIFQTWRIQFLDYLTSLQQCSDEQISSLRFRRILCEYLALISLIVLARAADSLEISVSAVSE